jgi:hypothetical protein
MGLPASQQRVLDRIEETLHRREPRLVSMFTMFTRLAINERLPRIEALEQVPWWSPRRYRGPAGIRAAVLLALASALVVSAVFLGMSQSGAGCAAPFVVRGPVAQAAGSHVRNCSPVPPAKGFGHGP